MSLHMDLQECKSICMDGCTHAAIGGDAGCMIQQQLH